MTGLQALAAYLDIWFLYQTDTFHAEIIINTCDMSCVTRRESGLKFSFLWRWLGWKLIIVFNWAYLCHCDYTVTTLWQHCVLVTNNTMYWPYTAYTWFIQLLLWRHHMVKATLKIELCEIEVENTSRELLIFEYQAWFEKRLRPSTFAHFDRIMWLRLFSNHYKRVRDHFILQLNGNVTQVGYRL